MKLSNNFKLNELIYSSTAEANNIDNYPSNQVKDNLIRLCVNILQPIRYQYGKPIFINSGYRSPILNRKIGGVPTSYHCSGDAADITTGNRETNKELFDLIVQMIKDKDIVVGELIDEHNYKWIHISNPVKEKNEILHLG